MALVFCDSFDHYDNLLQKWSSGVANFNTNLSFVRTGTQSLNPVSAGFPEVPRINFAHRDTMFCGFAYYPESFGIEGLQISYWYNVGTGGEYAELRVDTDGSLNVFFNNSFTAASNPGVINTGEFSYLEVGCQFFEGGFLIVRVNGAVVINTILGSLGAFTGVDSFLLPGSDVENAYYDDLYLIDDTGAENNTFLGAIQIFAILPDADESPLQWTPLASTNVSQVNQEPPPGDAAYVSSNTVGQIDQYHYPITGLPSSGYTIKAIQVSFCARLDSAGSHTVNCQINATTGGAPLVGIDAPSADYAFVITPWDINPNTGLPFVPSDFATTFIGPNLTS
jgi:hypothetical protein